MVEIEAEGKIIRLGRGDKMRRLYSMFASGFCLGYIVQSLSSSELSGFWIMVAGAGFVINLGLGLSKYET